jgi:hypothetical protein
VDHFKQYVEEAYFIVFQCVDGVEWWMHEEGRRHVTDYQKDRDKEGRPEVTPMEIGQYQRHIHKRILNTGLGERQGAKQSNHNDLAVDGVQSNPATLSLFAFFSTSFGERHSFPNPSASIILAISKVKAQRVAT